MKQEDIGRMFISRVDGSRARGWQVRVERKSLTVRRFYSDSKYGSNAKALKAATKFRDELVKKHDVATSHDGVLAFKNGKWVWE